MVGKHEDWGLKNGVVAPPALPVLVAPGTVLRAELAATHDLGPDSRAPVAGYRLVDARAAAGLPEHVVEGARLERPFVQARSGVAEWGVERLAFAGPVAVQRDAEVVYANER